MLFIPELKYNLISLGRLIDKINCSVTLFDNLCIIQDCISRMLIRVGKRKDRIWEYLALPLSFSFAGSVKLKDSSSLLHKR